MFILESNFVFSSLILHFLVKWPKEKNYIASNSSFHMVDYKHLIDMGLTFSQFIHRTKKNEKRFEEIYQSIEIPADIQEKIQRVDTSVIILTFAENWCTDSVVVVPILEKLSEINPKIRHVIVPRDDVIEEFNEHFLTGGKSKIPFVLFLNERFEELSRWVERSTYTIEKVIELKSQNLEKVDYYKASLALYKSKELIAATTKELSECLYKAGLMAKMTL